MVVQDETIVAISTPLGTGGIAVLRVSGINAIEIVNRIFQGRVQLKNAESHKAYWGRISAVGKDISLPRANQQIPQKSCLWDEVIVTVFKSPKSYTKEDVVEISCHGGLFLSKKILELILKQGARLAEPGEFTKRAFLNGRLDLNRAEAVADIIQAKTERSLQSALSQYKGKLSQQIKNLRQGMLDICSLLELELDFAEEDVVFASKADVQKRLVDSINEIEILIQSFEKGKILREGARLVIVGKPNVGKSSLLNALLKEDRVIVTELPGTTRDTIEEQLDVMGVLFTAVDTAGVRETRDAIEQAGVNRTLNQIENADVVLFLFDASNELDHQDSNLVAQVFASRKNQPLKSNKIIGVLNKTDLKVKASKSDLMKMLGVKDILEISVKQSKGFRELEKTLVGSALGENDYSQNEPVITNLRQKQALDLAKQSLDSAQVTITKGMSSEFVVVDIREALRCLGEMIGEVTSEDVLGNIFSKFCIGK